MVRAIPHAGQEGRSRHALWLIVVTLCALGLLWPFSLVSASTSPNPVNSDDIGDPISASSRAYYFHVPMFDLGGPLAVGFQLTYQSKSNFTQGFLPAIPSVMRPNSSSAYVLGFGDGRTTIAFDNSEFDGSGTWFANTIASYRYALQETPGGNGWFYLMDPSDQMLYLFEKNGRADDDSSQEAHLRYRIDRNGNQVEYSYPSIGHAVPTTISDGIGRTLTLTTDNSNRLGTVSDGTNTYTLGYDASDHLISITDPLGHVTAYQYSGDNLTQTVLPEGNAPYSQTYEGIYDGRVTSQTDAYANTTTIAVQDLSDPFVPDPVVETRPDGSTVTYTHALLGASPVAWQDAAGMQADFSVDANDRITAITDRMGDTSSISYHAPTGLLAAFTNARGDTLTYSYTANSQVFVNPANSDTPSFTFYDRARTDYPDGTAEVYTYDTHGNLVTYTDRAGHDWGFTYNGQGLALTVTNPEGGIVSYSYAADGTRTDSTDSDTGTTNYGYDSLKRLTSVDPPGNGQIDIVYDARSRITSVSDQNGDTYQYSYDKNGNLTKVTDPVGNATEYAYDLMDRVVQVTDRTSAVRTLARDFRGFVTATNDANGIQTGYSYDSRDRLTGIARNSKTLTLGSDDEAVPNSRTTPLGRLLQQQTDKLGNLSAVIQPGGQTTTITRDSLTRVTATVDPLSRQTSYVYDDNDQLVQVTLPGGASASYSRDTLGRLTGILDLNGQAWGFAYTSMGRPSSITDPLLRSRSFILDSSGRIATATYPDAVTETRSYDDAGRLTRRLFSDGTDLNYTYDSRGNLLTGEVLSLSRDNEGRITSGTYNGFTFGVSYDSGGRISGATYAGALTVSYGYDADNRLSQVTDDLGHQIDFTYDDDGNRTGLSRSNGIDASYTWDANGRLSRLQDGSIFDLQFGYDAAGQITAIGGTLPLDPVPAMSLGSEHFSVDVAAQIDSAGYAHDQRGHATQLPGHSLSWDGAERLVALDATTFAYNGQHEIVSRTEAANTTHYHHNPALGQSPIVADQQAGGFTRYYVYTPQGELLYSIDPQNSNAVAFYHRDQVGSTLALSDGAGAITDRYAYSPFGRLLAHTGSSDQPYTFVGTFGVRQEGALYQMRRRYYDPITARFLSPESLWPSVDDPRQLSPYQYALSSPLFFSDTTGLAPDTGETLRTFRSFSSDTNARLPDENAFVAYVVNSLLAEHGIAYSEANVARIGEQIDRLNKQNFSGDVLQTAAAEVAAQIKSDEALLKRFDGVKFQDASNCLVGLRQSEKKRLLKPVGDLVGNPLKNFLINAGRNAGLKLSWEHRSYLSRL